MRNVSKAYKNAVTAKELHTRITGTIQTAGRVYELTDRLIIPGSLSISRKAINRSSFEYGAAVTSELNLSILMDTDRYSMYGAIIVLWLHTRLTDDTEETMKLGTWNVSECTKTKKIIQFKCYDNMLLFDEAVMDDTTGSVYELLTFTCEKCGAELAQTEAEIQALVNGTMQLRVQEDDISTYRDLICYIGMVTCTFARINEDGKLVMQPFGKKPEGELIKRQVLASKISDFKSSNMGVTARFIADSNYAPYAVTDETLTGLILDMGDIPIVRGLPETKYQVLTNILNDLKSIIYTPVELSITGNPAIEPGDMITVKNANLTEDDIVTLITSTTWTYHGQMKLVSAGSNPRLATVKDKNQKQIESMETAISDKSVVLLSYTNSKDYIIRQTLVEIAEISYTTYENSKPIFLMTVQFELDLDGIVEFSLFNGLVAIPHAVYKGYYQAGEHFVTIFYPDSSEENERRNLRVLARAYRNENSIIRKQTAELKTLQNAIEAVKTTADLSKLTYVTAEPDTTEPTLTIGAQEIKAILYAQGISTKAEWDGDLEFTDYIPLVLLTGTGIQPFHERTGTWQDVPVPPALSERLALISLTSVTVSAFSADMVMNEVIDNYIVNTDKADYYNYNKKFVSIDAGKYSLKTVYEQQAGYGENNIARLEIDNTVYQEVREVDVT